MFAIVTPSESVSTKIPAPGKGLPISSFARSWACTRKLVNRNRHIPPRLGRNPTDFFGIGMWENTLFIQVYLG
jgi:hypothetical protein